MPMSSCLPKVTDDARAARAEERLRRAHDASTRSRTVRGRRRFDAAFHLKVAGALCAVLAAATVAIGTSRASAAATLPANCTGKDTVTCTFEYNGTDGTDGGVQTFTVPKRVNALTIDAWGAQGGGEKGGLGGHERATISVTPGETLQVFVGGRGNGSSGGYNGGGNGKPSGAYSTGGGGGASDVRRAPGGLADRLIVAGGGGGDGVYYFSPSSEPMVHVEGGAGGAMPGARSSESICGFAGIVCGGGGSTEGGPAAAYCLNPTIKPSPGAEGVGGDGGTCAGGGGGGAGGGGGYFGGGGGGFDGGTSGSTVALFFGPGGGGSGHVAAGAHQVHELGVHSGHGLVTITYGTKPVPPIGAIGCAVTGTATFSKPLTNVPSTKPVKVTLKLAGANCANSQAAGGKAPITDVAAQATLYLAPGATCSSAPYLPSKPQKLQVKWQGRNARNKLMTVATTKTTALPFTYSVFVPLFPLTSPELTDAKKAFVGDQILSSLVAAEGTFAQQASCASAEGLKTVNLVGVIGAGS